MGIFNRFFGEKPGADVEKALGVNSNVDAASHRDSPEVKIGGSEVSDVAPTTSDAVESSMKTTEVIGQPNSKEAQIDQNKL